jgi:DUF4097 and DUF4098 domain-containing protein YvlB
VTLRGMGHRVLVNTISGTIEAYEVAGDVRMNSVSGPIRMQSERLDRLDVKTISGDVDVTGKLAKGPHKIDAEVGAVKVRVSTDAPLSIEVTTASGTITDAFSDPPTRAKTRHQRNLAGGGPVLRVETVAGNIELAPRR